MNFVAFVVAWSSWSWPLAAQTRRRENIPYSAVKPIFDALRPELLPPDLRGKTPGQRETEWPEWVARRDCVAGMASPGTNERLQFARDVVRRHGIDPSTPAGKVDARRYLEERGLEDCFSPTIAFSSCPQPR